MSVCVLCLFANGRGLPLFANKRCLFAYCVSLLSILFVNAKTTRKSGRIAPVCLQTDNVSIFKQALLCLETRTLTARNRPRVTSSTRRIQDSSPEVNMRAVLFMAMANLHLHLVHGRSTAQPSYTSPSSRHTDSSLTTWTEKLTGNIMTWRHSQEESWRHRLDRGARPPTGAIYVGTMNMPVIGRQTFVLKVLGRQRCQITLIGMYAARTQPSCHKPPLTRRACAPLFAGCRSTSRRATPRSPPTVTSSASRCSSTDLHWNS